MLTIERTSRKVSSPLGTGFEFALRGNQAIVITIMMMVIMITKENLIGAIYNCPNYARLIGIVHLPPFRRYSIHRIDFTTYFTPKNFSSKRRYLALSFSWQSIAIKLCFFHKTCLGRNRIIAAPCKVGRALSWPKQVKMKICRDVQNFPSKDSCQLFGMFTHDARRGKE